MFKSLISYTLIASILFLSSGCASILNGKYQTVMVHTGASDAVVYVNNKKQGTGSDVRAKMQRDYGAKQVKVERPGYKSEYLVHRQSKKSGLVILSWIPFGIFYLVPPLMDRGPKSFNYTKEVTLKNSRKVNSKNADQKYVIMKNINFDVKKEDFLVESIDYKRFKKGKSSKSGDRSTLGEDIKVDNSIFSTALNNALLESGFIDTTAGVLKTKMNTTYVNARVSKMKFTTVNSYKGYYNRSIICESTIDWEFMDKYDQVKFKKTVVGKSGEFCSFPDENLNSKEGQEMSVIQRVVQDAITNSFYELLDNKEAKEWLKVVPDSLGKSTLPVLTINRGTAVKDIKSAMEATTVIMTNKGHGSGCVVGSDGYIVTSFHVVANVDSNIKVLFNNGDTVLAKVERISEISDLALLKVKRTCKASYLISETPAYEIADEVFAVGTPAAIDLGQTVSKGIISGIRKETNGVELIQTDVSVNPGNSGGALIKRDGTFVGVVNAKISGGGMEGLGFCTPAKQIISELKLNFK